MKQINFVVCGAGCRGASIAKQVLCNMEDVRVVGVQLPAYVEILTGGVRGILDGIDGEVVELQHMFIFLSENRLLSHG